MPNAQNDAAVSCPKCLGEDFPQHASSCPHRDTDSDKEPINLIDPDSVAACSYCGERVTRDKFVKDHSFKKCQTEAGITEAFHKDGQDILRGEA